MRAGLWGWDPSRGWWLTVAKVGPGADDGARTGWGWDQGLDLELVQVGDAHEWECCSRCRWIGVRLTRVVKDAQFQTVCWDTVCPAGVKAGTGLGRVRLKGSPKEVSFFP